MSSAQKLLAEALQLDAAQHGALALDLMDSISLADRSDEPPPNFGSYGSEDAALRIIVEKLVNGLAPRAVYLFGSRAERRARPDSDFDLVVVLDDNAPEECTTYEGAYAPLCGSGIGCDVIPCRVSELDEVLADVTNPWHQSWSNARKLYERG